MRGFRLIAPAALLGLLLPASVFAACCQCYKGTHSTANSFCLNDAAVTNCASAQSQISSVSGMDTAFSSDIICDGTILSDTQCALTTGSASSAQCRAIAHLNNADIRGAFPSTSAGTSGGTASTPDVPEVPFVPVTPSLGVPIPGTTLSPATKEGGSIRVAFLAQYINGVYHYLTAVILVIAIVMCVYGAFLYLLGAGGVGNIQRGKQIITNSIMGMLITLAGYAILNTVNPDTVNLKVLNLAYVRQEGFDPSQTSEFGGESSDETASEDTGGGTALGAGSVTPSSADCQRLSQIVQSNGIAVRAPNDRAGLISGTNIPRNSCIWCYAGHDRRGTDDDPCFDDPPGGPTVSPRLCKLLVDLYDAKTSGAITGNISIACVICGHTRAAQGREDTPNGLQRCDVTKRNIRSGNTGPTSGQSDHWDGLGVDLSPNASMQRYIVETLAPRYGSGFIRNVIGPDLWVGSTVTCPANADERSGSATSAYFCNNGRCGAGTRWGARELCGHRDHIHVGLYAGS